MFRIYDDIFTDNEKDLVENFLTDNKFAWHLGTGPNFRTVLPEQLKADGNENTRETVLLAHVFYLEGKKNSDNSHLSDFIMDRFLFRTKHPFKELIRSKANLQLRSDLLDPTLHSTPHIDFEDDHTVLLYYVNDTDGNTVLFDRTVGQPKTEYKIIEEIEPRKGRFLVFNGKYYHAARYPISNELRINVNINFR
jgi:hypothetical protein